MSEKLSQIEDLIIIKICRISKKVHKVDKIWYCCNYLTV